MSKKRPRTEHVIRVVLSAPRRPRELIIYAQHVHDMMATNAATLPHPDPPLVTLQAHIDDLATKEAALARRTAGAAADRDGAMRVLQADLNNERAYVEQIATQDPANAARIAEDAGMSLHKVPSTNKPHLVLRHGRVSGTVDVIAKAITGAQAYHRQYSIDGGVTWIDMPPTTKANATLANLTVKTTVFVRHRAVLRTGLTDWGDPVSIIVL